MSKYINILIHCCDPGPKRVINGHIKQGCIRCLMIIMLGDLKIVSRQRNARQFLIVENPFDRAQWPKTQRIPVHQLASIWELKCPSRNMAQWALCKPGGWRLLCNSDRLYPTLLCCIHKTINEQDFCEQELCFDKNDQVIQVLYQSTPACTPYEKSCTT